MTRWQRVVLPKAASSRRTLGRSRDYEARSHSRQRFGVRLDAAPGESDCTR